MPRTASIVDKHVGNRIRARRLAMDISQQTLAEAAGVSFQQLQKYEKGENRVSGEILVCIANRLHVTIADLYDGAPGLAADRRRNIAERTAADRAAAFMATPEGATIARALAALPSLQLRRSIANFVVDLAASQQQAAE